MERLVTEQVKHAYYERKTITEAVGEIVSALQASAMGVPDGWQLVELDTLSRWESELDQIAGAGHISDELIRMLSASTAPGDS